MLPFRKSISGTIFSNLETHWNSISQPFLVFGTLVWLKNNLKAPLVIFYYIKVVNFNDWRHPTTFPGPPTVLEFQADNEDEDLRDSHDVRLGEDLRVVLEVVAAQFQRRLVPLLPRPHAKSRRRTSAIYVIVIKKSTNFDLIYLFLFLFNILFSKSMNYNRNLEGIV